MRHLTWLAVLAWAVGCGSSGTPGTNGDGGPDSGHPDAGPSSPDSGGVDGGGDGGLAALFDGGPPQGAAITAPANTWTWVDFPGSACDDGSTTGVGVNISSTGSNVILYFEGGGACWDYQSCFVLNTAVHGPFGQTQFNGVIANFTGTIFDRTLTQNPFKDFSYVYIPYCTGDVHAGNNIITYSSGGTSRTYHHVGHVNALAYLERLGPTFATPGKVVVSGSSAGGGGVMSNYAFARAYWPTTPMYFLDDSLPFFEAGAVGAGEVSAWEASWNLAPLITQVCGADCLTDLSLMYPRLRSRFPADRMALLSSEQDGVISQYYFLTGPQFQTDLNALATQVLGPAQVHTFFVNGSTHTMLYNPGSFATTGSVALLTWLTQMTTDDPNWTSVGP